MSKQRKQATIHNNYKTIDASLASSTSDRHPGCGPMWDREGNAVAVGWGELSIVEQDFSAKGQHERGL